MSAAVVQTLVATETATSTTLAFSGVTTTTGNLLQLAIGIRDSAITVSSISDGSNTWAKSFRTASSGTAAVEVWTTTNSNPTALSSGTITITFSATVLSIARLWEISGAYNASAIDKSASAGASTTGTAASSGATATLTATNELAFGAIINDYGGTTRTYSTKKFTQAVASTEWPSATTGDVTHTAGNLSLEITAGDLSITSTTAQTYSATISTASWWAAAVWVLALVPTAITGSDTATGADAASGILVTATETGTGAEAATINVSAADTSTGADAATAFGPTPTDAAAGADSATQIAAATPADTSTVTDTPTQAAFTATDTQAGTEGTAITWQVAGAEAATATEGNTPEPKPVDTVAGAEAVSLALSGTGDGNTVGDTASQIGLTASEAGTAGEASAVTQQYSAADTVAETEGNTPAPNPADTATGGDAYSLLALTGSDSQAGADATVSAGPTPADTATGAESGSITAAIAATEAQAASEAGTITVSPATDTATGAETTTPTPLPVETATATESPAIGITAADTATGAGTESVAAGNNISSAETAAITESASIALAATDATTASETATPTINVVETATGAEANISQATTEADTSNSSDGTGPIYLTSPPDSAGASETAAIAITAGETANVTEAGGIALSRTDTAGAADLATGTALTTGGEVATGTDGASISILTIEAFGTTEFEAMALSGIEATVSLDGLTLMLTGADSMAAADPVTAVQLNSPETARLAEALGGFFIAATEGLAGADAAQVVAGDRPTAGGCLATVTVIPKQPLAVPSGPKAPTATVTSR